MLPTCKEVADCKKEASSSESRCNDEQLSTGESIKNIKPKLFPIFSKPRKNIHEILTIDSNEQKKEQEILKSTNKESPKKFENLKTNSRSTEKIKGNVRVSKSTVPNNPSIVISCDTDSSNHICEFEDVPIVKRKRRLKKVKHKLCDNVSSIPYDVTSANCNEKGDPSFKEIDAVVDYIINEVCSKCDQVQPVRKCATTKIPQISMKTKLTLFTNETSVFKENSETNKLFPIFTSPKSLKSLDTESILQERFSTEKDCKNQYLENDQQSTKNASKKSSINNKKRAKQKINNKFHISHVSESDDLCSPIKNKAKTSILKKSKNSKKKRKIKKSKLNISLDTDYVSESSNISSPVSLKIDLSKKLSCEVFKFDKTENSSLDVPTLINQATIKDNQIAVDSISSFSSSEIIKVSTFTNEKEINKFFPLLNNLNTSPNSLKKSVKTKQQEKKASLLENSQSDITDTLHNDSLSFILNKKENLKKQKRTKAASKKIDNVPKNSVFANCNLEPSNNSLSSEEVISYNKIISSGNKIDVTKRRTRNSLKRKQLYNSNPCKYDSVDLEIDNEYSSEFQQSFNQTITENFKQHNKKRKKEIKSSMILSAELTISNDNCLDHQSQINKKQKNLRQKHKTSLPTVESSVHDCSTPNKNSRVSKSSVLKNKLKNKSSIIDEESYIRVTRSKTVRKIVTAEFSEIEKLEHKDKKSQEEKSKSCENLKRLPQVKKIITIARKKSNLAKNSEIKNVELFPMFNLTNKKPRNLDSDKQNNKVKKIDAKKELTNCFNSKNYLDSNIIVIEDLDNNMSHLTKKKFLDLTEKNTVDHSSPKQENIVRNQKHSEIKILNPSYTFTKLVNNFTFPTYSHINQVDTFKNTNFLNYSFKEEICRDIDTVPVWQGIMGLTDLKTFKDVEKMTYRKRHQNFEVVVEDVENECQLWTEIPIDYNVGGTISQLTISDLNLWLSQWKTKFVKTSTKIKCNTVDNFSSDSNDSDMDDLSNSIIIMGPPGSGKTSLVSSLANDHGFKVLEVNASSSRSGRNINSQLKEALESYHVEKTQEMVFNSSTSENNTNNNFRKKVTGNSKDSFKETVKKTSINTFFKKTLDSDKKNVLKVKDQDNPKEKTDKSKTSISSNTIILFDDIDVIFEEDEGFWSTVRNFLKISKKPVIFTVSRNLDIVLSNLDLDVKVVYLQPMIKNAVSKKVMKQCEQHKRTNANFDLDFTVFYQCNDIRRSLLHAQFWSQIPNENFKFNPNLENISSVNFLNNENCSTFLWYHINSLIMSTGLLNVFSHYHKVGYDILYCNLYSLLKIYHNSEPKWPSISNQNSKISLNEVNYKIKDSYKDDHKNLWKEACEIFEAKKQTLQTGSHSSVLAVFSEILDDFSFVESFKGFYCKSMNWISTPERVKCWGQGLPMCHDCIFKNDHENVLDMASLIQILKLKTMHKNIVKWEDSIKSSNFKFSAVGLNNSQQYKSENQINVVKSALPHNVSLNASALNLDYLSTLQIICRTEKLKKSKGGKRTNRFLHYFDSISLLIENHDIEKIIS